MGVVEVAADRVALVHDEMKKEQKDFVVDVILTAAPDFHPAMAASSF